MPKRSPPVLDRVLEEIQARKSFTFLACAGRRAHERREPAQGADRRGRRGGCTRRASRNDQVATDFKLWVRDWIDGAGPGACGPCRLALGAQGGGAFRPGDAGFSRICSRPSPSPFGHHLLAYVEMLSRDRGPLRRCARPRGLNECPLGAAALCPARRFPIDRHMTAEGAGLRPGPPPNSLDGRPADRGLFALETPGPPAAIHGHASVAPSPRSW